MSTTAYELASCPVCGSVEATELADAEGIRAEVEALWEFHTARLAPDTPPERLVDRVTFSQLPPLRVVRCDRCGLVYRNPRERAFELARLYRDEALDQDALDALFETQRDAYATKVERLTSAVGRAGYGLEVGSYVGAFLAAAASEGWRFEGVDVNEHTVAQARQRGLEASVGDLESIPDDRRYDAIVIWNCFDQLPDPKAAALAARRRLVDRGVLALRVPNGAFYATVRKALDTPAAPVARALLAHNNLLSFPYRHGFTPGSLALLLEKAGFEPDRVHGDALVPIADRWTRGWAAAEERALKTLLRTLGRGHAEGAPWFEVYARVSDRA
jgi:2-polyprenyl-3-methyl-5-hydroxy-6-metoxy-1,4-benzoquinol methylase